MIPRQGRRVLCGLPVLGLLTLALGCTETSRPSKPSTSPKRAERPSGESRVADGLEPASTDRAPDDPTPPDDRIACQHDDDCLASCRHGAVSKAWHIAAYPGEEACEDGCANKGTESPRCEAGSCVAYRDGDRHPVCTRVDRAVLAGPGPAHRCTVDADCMQTCAHGAINREWFSWHDFGPDCRDGCTRKGTDPPRCEEGQCVAYHLGTRDDLCTARSVRDAD
jgi:hypothetical protein